MSKHIARWREWPRVRTHYALQATISDLLAFALGFGTALVAVKAGLL